MSRDERPPAAGEPVAPGPQERRSEFLRERGMTDDPDFYSAAEDAEGADTDEGDTEKDTEDDTANDSGDDTGGSAGEPAADDDSTSDEGEPDPERDDLGP